MTRNEFEQAAKNQNERRAQEILKARESGVPCVIVPMLSFGGIDYCTIHRVMGTCPFSSLGHRLQGPFAPKMNISDDDHDFRCDSRRDDGPWMPRQDS